MKRRQSKSKSWRICLSSSHMSTVMRSETSSMGSVKIYSRRQPLWRWSMGIGPKIWVTSFRSLMMWAIWEATKKLLKITRKTNLKWLTKRTFRLYLVAKNQLKRSSRRTFRTKITRRPRDPSSKRKSIVAYRRRILSCMRRAKSQYSAKRMWKWTLTKSRAKWRKEANLM